MEVDTLITPELKEKQITKDEQTPKPEVTIRENCPPMNKSNRIEEANLEIENRLETLITRLGDLPPLQPLNTTNIENQQPSLQNYMQQLNKHLDDLSVLLEGDLQDHKSFILRILVLCSYQLPNKCCIYTTLVGLLNIKNYHCGAEIIQLLVNELNVLLTNEKYDQARFVIRFLCDLVNSSVVSAPSVIMFLESLLDVVQEEDVCFVRKDFYCFAIMSALPWCGKELFDKLEARPHLEEITTVLEQYLNSEERKIHAIQAKQMLAVWRTDDPYTQNEYLSVLLEQLQSMRNNTWQERFLLRPYLSFKDKLDEALQHDIPPFEAPLHSASSRYPTPKIIYRMFDLHDVLDSDGKNLPAPKTIERFIVEEQIAQTLEIYKKDRKMAADRLLNLPGGNRIPIQTMVVEVLFGQLFRLPEPTHPYVAFYTCVFIELCKLQPTKIPPILGNACETIYERVDTMSIQSRQMFEEWFAHHLSNFQFLWGWDSWTDGLDEHIINSFRLIFVKEIFENCLRLSYYSKLSDLVPEEIRHLLPNEPICRFKFKRKIPVKPAPTPLEMLDQIENENNPDLDSINSQDELDPLDLDENLASRRDWAKKLVENIKSRQTSNEIIEFLNEIPKSENGPDGCLLEEGCHWEAIDVFITTILEFRKRSISHTTSALNTYMPVFLELGKTDMGKKYMLWTLFEVWRDHKQMLTVVIDKMLSCCILSPNSVIKWCLSDELSDELSRCWIWTIIFNTIKKMRKHVNKVTFELEETCKKIESVQNLSAEIELEKNDINGDSINATLNSYALFAPDEEELVKVEGKLKSAKDQQKDLYIKCMTLLSNKITKQTKLCETLQLGDDRIQEANGILLLTIYIERLKELLLKFQDNILEHAQLLSKLIFNDADERVKIIFKQFQSLSS